MIKDTLPADFKLGELKRIKSGRGNPGERIKRGQVAQPGQPAMTKLGRRLRELRISNNMTQKDIGAMVGTSSGRVSDWERGFHLPGLIILCRYAAALDTTVAEILKNVI